MALLSCLMMIFRLCYNLQVDINNLEEYISLVVDATVKTGIMRQMEAFRAGFNQVIFNSVYELDNFLKIGLHLMF